jgi:hypothetical protein
MKKIIFIPFLIIVIVFTIGCNNGNKKGQDEQISTDLINNPNTADGKTDLSSLPKFQFVEEEHDFGKIIQGEKVSWSFRFKNIGKSDMIISSVKGSCGCTVADFPKKPIPPGEENQITVSFDSEGKRGMQNKTLTVAANTQPNVKILTIKAEIVEP